MVVFKTVIPKTVIPKMAIPITAIPITAIPIAAIFKTECCFPVTIIFENLKDWRLIIAHAVMNIVLNFYVFDSKW